MRRKAGTQRVEGAPRLLDPGEPHGLREPVTGGRLCHARVAVGSQEQPVLRVVRAVAASVVAKELERRLREHGLAVLAVLHEQAHRPGVHVAHAQGAHLRYAQAGPVAQGDYRPALRAGRSGEGAAISSRENTLGSYLGFLTKGACLRFIGWSNPTSYMNSSAAR